MFWASSTSKLGIDMKMESGTYPSSCRFKGAHRPGPQPIHVLFIFVEVRSAYVQECLLAQGVLCRDVES